jgi:putative spermidine/putrescine transport system permease protein
VTLRWTGLALASPLMIILLVIFLAPVIIMLPTSFQQYVPGAGISDGWTIANYTRIVTDEYYREIVGRTLLMGTVVTFLTFLLGYPLALFMARTTPFWRATATLLVIFPLFLNLVVRSFGWITILANRGIINTLLMDLGLTDEPIKLLFNLPGLVIGLTHIYLPFMVLMLLSAIQNIPRDVEHAAATLAAGKIRIFLTITLPLTAPGILAGSILVFVLTISALVTPRLLGGPTYKVMATLIYDEFMLKLDWPSGASFSFILTIMALLIIWAAGRIARHWSGGTA